MMANCSCILALILSVTVTVVFEYVTCNDHFTYNCEPGHVAAVFDRGPDYVKIQCGPLTVCGESKGCSELSSCSSKGSYMCGVDQGATESVQTNCCNYGAPMQKHKSDDCHSFELYDQYDPYNDKPKSVNGPMSPDQSPPLGPDGKPAPPNGKHPLGGGGGGKPPSPSAGDAGGPGGKGYLKHNPINKLYMSYYEVTAPVNPMEMVKAVQKLPNGYRVTVCKIKCQTNDTSTTRTTTMFSRKQTKKMEPMPNVVPVVPIKGQIPPKSADSPIQPPLASRAVGAPKSTSGSAPGSCTVNGQEFLNSLASESKGSSSTSGIPGYTKEGTYCEGSKDVGCLSECLRILQQRYKSAYCATNSTCICSQTNDTENFSERLMQQGLVKPPASCCKQASPEDANLINKVMKGQKDQQSVPPFRKPGTYCKGVTDAGCFNKCLSVLQKLFKSVTCDASNSNCICRQDSNPQNFEKNLKAMGIDAGNPSCKETKPDKNGGKGGKGGQKPPIIPYVPVVPVPNSPPTNVSSPSNSSHTPEIIVDPPETGSNHGSNNPAGHGNQSGGKPPASNNPHSGHESGSNNPSHGGHNGNGNSHGNGGIVPVPVPIPGGHAFPSGGKPKTGGNHHGPSGGSQSTEKGSHVGHGSPSGGKPKSGSNNHGPSGGSQGAEKGSHVGWGHGSESSLKDGHRKNSHGKSDENHTGSQNPLKANSHESKSSGGKGNQFPHKSNEQQSKRQSNEHSKAGEHGSKPTDSKANQFQHKSNEQQSKGHSKEKSKAGDHGNKPMDDNGHKSPNKSNEMHKGRKNPSKPFSHSNKSLGSKGHHVPGKSNEKDVKSPGNHGSKPSVSNGHKSPSKSNETHKDGQHPKRDGHDSKPSHSKLSPIYSKEHSKGHMDMKHSEEKKHGKTYKKHMLNVSGIHSHQAPDKSGKASHGKDQKQDNSKPDEQLGGLVVLGLGN